MCLCYFLLLTVYRAVTRNIQEILTLRKSFKINLFIFYYPLFKISNIFVQEFKHNKIISCRLEFKPKYKVYLIALIYTTATDIACLQISKET